MKKRVFPILSFLLAVFILASCAPEAGPAQTTPEPEPNEPEYLVRDGLAPLLEDVGIDRGLWVGGTEDGKPFTSEPRDFIDIKGAGSGAFPAWTLAQWCSQKDIRDGAVETTAEGHSLSDGHKRVSVAADGAVTLEILGGLDYSEELRGSGGGWPHLAMGQSLAALPGLSELSSLTLRADVRPNYLESHMAAENEAENTALFTVSFIVQNRRDGSPGYGDYYWLQLILFDKRGETYAGFAAGDDGGKDHSTGKLIYAPASALYYDGTFGVGKTAELDADLLPLMIRGYETAAEMGFLKDTKVEDLCVADIVYGWEMFGSYDASVTVSNLELIAGYADGRSVTKDAEYFAGFERAGDWALRGAGVTAENGLLSDRDGVTWGSGAALTRCAYRDFTLETELAFAPGYPEDCWAGFAFRKPAPNPNHGISGYSIMIRPSGEIFLFTKNRVEVGEIENFSPTEYNKLRLTVKGSKFEVYVNGGEQPVFSVEDGAYGGYGYLGVLFGMARASFNGFAVTPLD